MSTTEKIAPLDIAARIEQLIGQLGRFGQLQITVECTTRDQEIVSTTYEVMWAENPIDSIVTDFIVEGQPGGGLMLTLLTADGKENDYEITGRIGCKLASALGGIEGEL